MVARVGWIVLKGKTIALRQIIMMNGETYIS